MKTHKYCKTCDRFKVVSEFCNSVRAKDGFVTQCKMCVATRMKKYRLENKETISTKKKEYNAGNKSHKKEYDASYRQTNMGKVVKANSDSKRRKLKRDTADGTLPQTVSYPLTTELSDLLVKQSYRCNECNTRIHHKLGNIHLDHIHPLSKGGTHSVVNVQWLCDECNIRKSDG